jgi:hypothetical protein
MLPIRTLDKPQYDFVPMLYQRMEPVLRLATLFLRATLPDIAKVRCAAVKDNVLSDGWRCTETKLRGVEDELMRMCSYYRITISKNPTMNFPDTVVESASTGTMANALNEVFAQTSINMEWVDFLGRADWDTMAPAEKYSKYLLMATMFVHELTHAVWCHRTIPRVEAEIRRNGQDDQDYPEPRFTSTDGYSELGYAIELQLLGGLTAFPHLGTLTAAEETCYFDPERMILTLIDVQGRVTAVHPMTHATVFSFFNPRTWMQSADGALPDLALELLPNIQQRGRSMSTILSRNPDG